MSCCSVFAQSHLAGRVFAPGSSGQPEPVPDAVVTATVTKKRPVVIAWGTTDAQGRYELSGLPEGRVELACNADGFYTQKAGDLESRTIARTCPATGTCPPTDFELAPASVLEGWLVDSFGEPLADVRLRLRRRSHSGEPAQNNWRGTVGTSVSDDRGYFRIWDLRPGAYELLAEYREFTGGTAKANSTTQPIDIAPGQAQLETRVQLNQGGATFTVSGRLAGWNKQKHRRSVIEIQPLDARGYGWRTHSLLRDAEFVFAGLAPGHYLFRIAEYGAERHSRLLETVHLDRDLEDLVLTPKGPTGVRGRVVFVDAPPADLRIGLTMTTSGFEPGESIAAAAPDYTFEHDGLMPGEWSTRGTFGEYFVLDPEPFTVRVGELTELEIRVSNRYGSIRGRMELPGEAAAAHYTVGIRGAKSRRSVQTDDEGGFVLSRLVPGDYEIAAWPRPSVDVTDDAMWQSSATELLPITIEPGFEVEIDLAVKP